MFIVTSLYAFGIDIVAFQLFLWLMNDRFPGEQIFIATVLARLISAYVNYLFKKNTVFAAGKTNRRSLSLFYLLTFLQMLASAFLVNSAHVLLRLNETLVKMLVDTLLFLLSYQIQKKYIFKPVN